MRKREYRKDNSEDENKLARGYRFAKSGMNDHFNRTYFFYFKNN